MPTSAVALQIFLILLPGFAAAYVVQILTVRGKQTDLDKVIEALLFSFLIYVTYFVFHRDQQPLNFIHTNQSDSIEFHPGNLLWLTAITLSYAVGMILFVNRDGTRFLRRINLTERTSRSSIWNDVFQGVQQAKDPSPGFYRAGRVGRWAKRAGDRAVLFRHRGRSIRLSDGCELDRR